MLLPLFFALFLLPVATLWIFIQLEKRKDRRSPLTEGLLRQPAESLQDRRFDLAFELLQGIFVSAVVPGACVLIAMYSWVRPEDISLNSGVIAAIFLYLATAGWSVWNTLRAASRLHANRAGIEGELATAQLLSPLLADGWQLYHDIPGRRGNIDHVLIGPGGIFAIESKYRSKRRSIKGKQSAQAEYDGESIRFAGGVREELPIQQATAVARELSKLLHDRLGEKVSVTPVVALPGWFVSNTSRLGPQHALVINPKNPGYFRKLPACLDAPTQIRANALLADLARRPKHWQEREQTS